MPCLLKDAEPEESGSLMSVDKSWLLIEYQCFDTLFVSCDSLCHVTVIVCVCACVCVCVCVCGCVRVWILIHVRMYYSC